MEESFVESSPILCETKQEEFDVLSNQTIVDQSIQEVKKKEAKLNYAILFDQIVDTNPITGFIKELSKAEIFKKEQMEVGHFLIHQNGLYDFHKDKSTFTDTDRKEMEVEGQKINGSIEDNFMWTYNKEMNLCEEIKPTTIPQIGNSIEYLPINNFISLPQPTLGLSIASSLTKAEEIKHKELQNKKIMEFYLINIGTKIRIVLMLLNFNKNYSLLAEEQKELTQMLMLYGSFPGEIKFQTNKVEIAHQLIKNSEMMYHILVFPGAKLSSLSQGIPENQISILNSTLKRKANEESQIQKATPQTSFSLTQSQLMKYKNVVASRAENYGASHMSMSRINQVTHASRFIDLSEQFNEQIGAHFHNYHILRNQDNDCSQKIIKEYLCKKENNLRLELEKIRDKVRDMKITNKVEILEVDDLRVRCTKALEKISQGIIDLQKLGVKNVEKHMDWLKIFIDDKKQTIKEEEDEIEQINLKIIEGKKSHQYFCKKMIEFREKLKEKQQTMLRQGMKYPERLEQIERAINNKEMGNKQKCELTDLSQEQLLQLEQHKENLKIVLKEKLKKCHEKRNFVENLMEVKGKITRFEVAKLEQKYFDLLHD